MNWLNAGTLRLKRGCLEMKRCWDRALGLCSNLDYGGRWRNKCCYCCCLSMKMNKLLIFPSCCVLGRERERWRRESRHLRYIQGEGGRRWKRGFEEGKGSLVWIVIRVADMYTWQSLRGNTGLFTDCNCCFPVPLSIFIHSFNVGVLK